MRALQLRWTDEPEDAWKFVRHIFDHQNAEQIVAEAVANDAMEQNHFKHTFHAVFRVIEVEAIPAFDRKIDINHA